MMDQSQPLISDHDSNVQIVKDVLSSLIGSLSGQMFAFGLGLMLLNQTKSPISFGLSMIIDPLVSLLFVVPIGNLIDTHNHRKVIATSMSVRIIALLIFMFTINLFNGHAKLIPVIIFLVIEAISVNVNSSGYSASVHELVNDGKIQRLNSLTQTASSLAMIISPALGVTLYSLMGFQFFVIFALCANVFSLGIFISMKYHHIQFETTEEDKESTSSIGKFKSALHYIDQLKVIKYTIVVAILFNFLYTSITVGVPYIIKEQFHFGNSSIGILDTSAAVGMLCGGIAINFMPKKTSYIVKLVWPLILSDVIFVMLGTLFVSMPSQFTFNILGAVIMFTYSVFLSILNISIAIFLQEKVKSGMLGRVTSLMYTGCTSVMPVGVLTYTMLFDHVNNGGLIILTSSILLVIYSAFMLPLLIKRLKDM